MLRHELSEHNKSLVAAAQQSGVETPLDYAIFQDHGYKGLYGGLGAKDIHQRKGIKKSQKILDHMGSTELAANLFRATQTEEKLRRDKVQGKTGANQTHYEVGQKVRKTIQELGGTMPEDLPTPESSIQQIERKKISAIKKRADDE
jgi:DNA-damage-inducible protein D